MRIIQLKCPNCGANLEIGDDRETVFCQYCGKKIAIEDENKYTYVDLARIREIESKERVERQKIEQAEKKFAIHRKEMTFYIGACVLICFIALILHNFYPNFANFLYLLVGIMATAPLMVWLTSLILKHDSTSTYTTTTTEKSWFGLKNETTETEHQITPGKRVMIIWAAYLFVVLNAVMCLIALCLEE